MPSDLGFLATPERNRYFYGLLMDAERFQKDQDYFNRKRRTLNRFVSGNGVVCGLGLTFTATTGTLQLSPGIAIDQAGREIIVPAAVPVNIGQLTDAHGMPTGPVPTSGDIIVALAYAERKTGAVAVLVPDCDHPNGCAPSTIEEGYAILVRVAAGPTPPIAGCVFGAFPSSASALQAALAGRIAALGGPAPDDASIPLGRLTLPAGPLDTVSDRPVVYDNTLLFQLIVCLAAQVGQLAGVVPVYVSGDNQTAKAGAALGNPLVVAVVDWAGNPVTGGTAPVFTPSGGGTVGAVTSTGPGQYQATWTLGASGAQTAAVHVAGSPITVTFNATIAP